MKRASWKEAIFWLIVRFCRCWLLVLPLIRSIKLQKKLKNRKRRKEKRQEKNDINENKKVVKYVLLHIYLKKIIQLLLSAFFFSLFAILSLVKQNVLPLEKKEERKKMIKLQWNFN